MIANECMRSYKRLGYTVELSIGNYEGRQVCNTGLNGKGSKDGTREDGQNTSQKGHGH